jgi:hypothetical protein
MATIYTIIFAGMLAIFASSCKTTTSLAIPTNFSEQSNKMEVSGSRSRYVKFGNYKTSKIKRGWHTTSSGSRRDHSLEGHVMRGFGVDRSNETTKEKQRFSFSINNGNRVMEVKAEEYRFNVDRNTKLGNGNGIFNNFGTELHSEYGFNAVIYDVDKDATRPWTLSLGNVYDKRYDTSKVLLKYNKDIDQGTVTNGTDVVVIREIRTKKLQGVNGKVVNFPVELLAGYELRIDDGVSAIVDVIKKDVWFYKELDEEIGLLLAAVSTALLARRVKDVQW